MDDTRTNRMKPHVRLFALLALLLTLGLSASVAMAGLPSEQAASQPAAVSLDTGTPDQANDAGVASSSVAKFDPLAPCTVTATGDISVSDPTQTNRLFRDGIPDTCAGPNDPCATLAGTFHYDIHTFTNQSGAQACVTFTLDTPCTGTNFIYAGTYVGPFNPASICTNYVGSPGSSPNGAPISWEAVIPAGATFHVVVAEVTANAGCASYTVTVNGDICPNATPTPPPPTATNTAVATPTSEPCTVMFSDVPPTDPFYADIRCLACRGILGGYSDGTFRPYNNITRGQIAKVVSNAAGFSEPVSGQTYADVDPTNPFYEWIERLSARGIMGGYPCGGVGEPCDPQNRPYFRWGANATRGQLSKIVANAAGFSEPVSGQTFADVPPTNPFYAEIERLASRGIIGGYPCGGVGEPCDPQNRPYFRWGANVTRGQASKIVANTFFPGCVTPR